MKRSALLISVALTAAVAAAAKTDPTPCPACLNPENAGLCHSQKCQREVLPVLKEGGLKAYTASGTYHDPVPPKADNAKPASDHAQRMARQSEKAAIRLGRALQGSWTKTRRPAAPHRG